MLQGFARSGMSNMDAFIFEDLAGGVHFGGLPMLLLALVLGVLGGLVGVRQPGGWAGRKGLPPAELVRRRGRM